MKSTRQAYGEEIAEIVKSHSNVVVLDADLSVSTYSVKAKEVCPERFFNVGIAESNMMGIASGLALSGYIPFVSSFAMFSTGRAWEQIRNSIVHTKANVKIIGTHAGVTVGEDGSTHQAIEDIAIMRAISGMQVYVPCDEWQTKAVVKHVLEVNAPCYIRLGRSNVKDVFDENKEFDFEHIDILHLGTTNIAIFTTGILVQETLLALKKLQEYGIDPTIVNICSLFPCDEEGIIQVLKENQYIYTIEEHSITGGLGSLICEISMENCPRKIKRIGMKDFGHSGSANELLKEYQLDSEGIFKQVFEGLG